MAEALSHGSAAVPRLAWSPCHLVTLSSLRECPAAAARGRLEVQPAHEPARLGGAVGPVHARVVPIDGQGAVVAALVEGADQGLPIDPAPPRRAPLPAAPRVALGPVGAEQP